MVQPKEVLPMDSSGGATTATEGFGEYFYYSLFVGPTGAPLPSFHPTSLELPCTSSFPIREVPEPLIVKTILEFIGARENIHPSRLWLSSIRGNQKRKMVPVSRILRGRPSTAPVPPSPDAMSAVVITVHLPEPFRREQALTTPPLFYRYVRANLDYQRRAELGCEAAVGPTLYHGCGAVINTLFIFCFMSVGGREPPIVARLRAEARRGRNIQYYLGPDGVTYIYYDN